MKFLAFYYRNNEINQNRKHCRRTMKEVCVDIDTKLELKTPKVCDFCQYGVTHASPSPILFSGVSEFQRGNEMYAVTEPITLFVCDIKYVYDDQFPHKGQLMCIHIATKSLKLQLGFCSSFLIGSFCARI